MVTEYKTCTYCKESKVREGNFGYSTLKSGRQKWSSRCKPCTCEIVKSSLKAKAWREANRERLAELARLRRKANPVVSREYARNRYIANKTVMLERARLWKETNKERANQVAREWRIANEAHVKATAIKWKEANKERLKETAREWRKTNETHVKAIGLKWRNAHRDELVARARQQTELLSDVYVRSMLLRGIEATPELIELKREQVAMKRIKKLINETLKEHNENSK